MIVKVQGCPKSSPLPSNQTRFRTEQSLFVYSYSTNTLCLFPKYFIKQRQYLVGMFHPRCYARRLVSPFLTGLHLIDNFPLHSLARLPQLSIVLDNVDGSLTTVVVCFDKYIQTNVCNSKICRIGSLPSVQMIFTFFNLECNSPKHVANGESYLIARLTIGKAKAQRVYFTKTYDLGHSSSTFKHWICICMCFLASNTYKR